MIQDNNFEEELLYKIKDEKLQPKPKWQFLLKNFLLWALGVLALFLGAIAMSLIFYMFSHNDLDIYSRVGGRLLEKIFLMIPLFWLVCLILFVILVFYNFKHTKKGYRYPLILILPAIICASIILGGIFYVTGVGKIIDDLAGRHAPFYDRIINPRIDFWSRPKEGKLMGFIISQTGEELYLLVDRDRIEWKVFTGGAKRGPDAELEIGQPARFLGEVQDDNLFKASEILPTMPGGEFFIRFGPSLSPELRQIEQRSNE
jgi:uncharacterized membrane protein